MAGVPQLNHVAIAVGNPRWGWRALGNPRWGWSPLKYESCGDYEKIHSPNIHKHRPQMRTCIYALGFLICNNPKELLQIFGVQKELLQPNKSNPYRITTQEVHTNLL